MTQKSEHYEVNLILLCNNSFSFAGIP